jgi:SAM-dependent methyltransferase
MTQENNKLGSDSIVKLGNTTFESEFSSKTLRKLKNIYLNSSEHDLSSETLDNLSQEIIYNLSPKRASIVRWMNIKPTDKVLEIGSQCGVITEYLVTVSKDVHSYDPSSDNAEINRLRNYSFKNSLKLYCGDFDKMPLEKYDKIICVNYQKTLSQFSEKDSFALLLKHIKSRLKKNGELVICVENRIGIKFFNGEYDNITGDFFEDLDCMTGTGVSGRLTNSELREKLSIAGFTSTKFYYPFPDHNTPKIIYSDKYYPGNGAQAPLVLLPPEIRNTASFRLFSEQAIMTTIEQENLFTKLSDSFLVEAKL